MPYWAESVRHRCAPRKRGKPGFWPRFSRRKNPWKASSRRRSAYCCAERLIPSGSNSGLGTETRELARLFQMRRRRSRELVGGDPLLQRRVIELACEAKLVEQQSLLTPGRIEPK